MDTKFVVMKSFICSKALEFGGQDNAGGSLVLSRPGRQSCNLSPPPSRYRRLQIQFFLLDGHNCDVIRGCRFLAHIGTDQQRTGLGRHRGFSGHPDDQAGCSSGAVLPSREAAKVVAR